MSRPTQSRFLLLLILGLAAVAVGVLGFLGGEAPERPAGPEPVAVRAPPASPPAPQPLGLASPSEPEPAARPLEPLEGTLELALELLWGDLVPTDLRPPRTGVDARLEGRLADAWGNGLAARVEFVAGPNRGRSALADETGRFEMAGLFPGLGIVEIRHSAVVGARREVLIGRGRTSTLNLGFGRPALVAGRVSDREGQPLGGALVVIDGREVSTAEDGSFQLAGVASGPVLVEVSKEGYAAYRERLHLAADSRLPPDRLLYSLEEGAEAVLSLGPSTGRGELAEVVFTPVRSDGGASFPWHRVNPVRVAPGGTVGVVDLPSGPVMVRAFHGGAASEPRMVSLRRGSSLPVEIAFTAGERLAGRVLRDGRPEAGIAVTLEAPDPVRATLAYLGETSSLLANEVLPLLPPARQQTVSDAEGRFVLTTFPGASGAYYLHARSADGLLWGGRVVRTAAREVELELEPLAGGDSELEVRVSGLDRPVAVRVVGPVPVQAGELRLDPERGLLLEGLRSGVWSVRVRWRGEELLARESLEVRGHATLVLDWPALPAEPAAELR